MKKDNPNKIGRDCYRIWFECPKEAWDPTIKTTFG